MKTLLQKLQDRAERRSKYFSLKAQRLLRNKKRLATFLLFFILISGTGYFIADNLIISRGESLDKNLFLKSNGEINVGDYVVLSIPNDPIIKGRYITKKVVCKEGQVLKIINDDYFCDDNYIGKAVKTTKDGHPVKPYNPCLTKDMHLSDYVTYTVRSVDLASICEYKIPQGYYFVAGTHPRSYDSRYFGLVTKKEIVTKAKPVL